MVIAYGQNYPDPLADETRAEVAEDERSGQRRIAHRLEHHAAGQLIHVYGIGWHHWDGKRWAVDDVGAAERAVGQVLDAALLGSRGAGPDRKQLRRDVQRCESANGTAGVLSIASTLETFARTVRDLDADPYLLTCGNGTFDLRSGQLRPHDPADGITKATRGAVVDTAGGAWSNFLTTVLPDAEVRGFLQRLIGVALLGRVREHVLPILTGIGGNGKGTLYGALMHALGDYAASADPDLFMHREGKHPTGEMDLRGLRLVVVSENDKDRRIAEATTKRLTGGDMIKARSMHRDFVQFAPSHTPLLVTNHLPKVSGDDPAMWRRIRVIPFDVVIPDWMKEKDLDERLQLAADDVLAWAIAGYREYSRRGGLDEPDAVKVATDNYQQSMHAVARFIAEECLLMSDLHATTGELFARWTKWAAEDGAELMSLKAFGLALDHDYPVRKSNGRKLRRGIGLLADETEPNE